jgi:ribonucleoside-diphosphate reductase alpha chain
MNGPQTAFAEQLHAEKYRTHGESFKEAMNRIAAALTDKEEDFKPFRDLLLDMRFLPAGRVQAAVGATRRTTAYNCFVSAAIQDSFVTGKDSIMDCAAQAAMTMRMGGGIGYDFSTLRPRGAMIKKLQSKSSGPISFMEIFDAVGRATSSAGHRRGAQMSVLRVDHPDIEEFIHAKQTPGYLTGFNMSIGITDKFMESLARNRPFELTFDGEVHGEVDAAQLWEMIMRSTWDWAEPGVLFIDRINAMNNLWYCETIAATNPCGEQPLPPYGACLLGSFNLPKYITGRSFEWDQFRRDIHIAVAAMDRVTDVSLYPLDEQEAEAKSKRRMGLGVTGLANAIEAIGPRYGTRDFVIMESHILDVLRDETYRASMMLARERGSFPLFDADRYACGNFIKTLPRELQNDIREYGIRNSHLTSIAPTGTISMAADNVSSGIEPVFALRSNRIVNMSDGVREVVNEDYGLAQFGVEGKTCDMVTVQEHLDVLIAAALRVDSAVSKTCNVPSDTPWSEFKAAYVQAYDRGAKGCTTYRVGGKREGILTAANDNGPGEGAACVYDPATGARSCE